MENSNYIPYKGYQIHVLFRDISEQETDGCWVEKDGVEVAQWCPSIAEAKKGIDALETEPEEHALKNASV